jgi:endonuclease III
MAAVREGVDISTMMAATAYYLKTIQCLTHDKIRPTMPKRLKPIHHAADFGLDVTSGDDDMFRWFLLAYLFGKPIQSSVAAHTWQLFMDRRIDTPWAILNLPPRQLVSLLDEGKYTRYDEVMTRSLRTSMQQIINDYEGSLMLLYELSENEDEFSKRLQRLYGVGPKTAEIFMRETEELFARRVE